MRVAVRLARGEDADRILLKIAGVSALAHVAALIVFSFLPRLMAAPPMPRATIAEIVPASALDLPMGSPAPQQGPTPTQRAEAAREAQRKKPPEPPKPVPKPKAKADTKVPPLEDRPSKPKPAEDPDPPAPAAEERETTPAPEPASPAGEGTARSSGGISFGEEVGPGGIPSIGSSAFPYDYYRSSLVSILQSNWRRPVAPQGLSRSVSARVQFVILKSGIIQDPRLVERSGNEALDASALRVVYDSNPLPPLPFQYGHASVTAEVMFELTPE